MRILAGVAVIGVLSSVLVSGQENNQQIEITGAAPDVSVEGSKVLSVNGSGKTEATVIWRHAGGGELTCAYGGNAGEFTLALQGSKPQRCEAGAGKGQLVFKSGDQVLSRVRVKFQSLEEGNVRDNYALYATIAAGLGALLSGLQAILVPGKMREALKKQAEQASETVLGQTKVLQRTVLNLTRSPAATGVVQEKARSKGDTRTDIERFLNAVKKWCDVAGNPKTVDESCDKIRRLRSSSSANAASAIDTEAANVAIAILRQSDLQIGRDRSSKNERLLSDIVDSAGLTLIDPSPKTIVDPALHKSTKTERSSGSGKRNVIAEVTLRGLRSGSQVIQKAEVTVFD